MPESKKRKKPPPPPSQPATAPRGNPKWFVPLMLSLMIAGLVWVVVTYIMSARWPIPGIGNWNLAVGFVLIISGFLMTTRWR